VFTLRLASFPRLIKLFYFCKCPPFTCFSLFQFFFLFRVVGFRFDLVPFWGCLNLFSHALVCFIKSLKSSRMRLGKPFTYPLIELFKTRQMN
jgi:hypothetical protein